MPVEVELPGGSGAYRRVGAVLAEASGAPPARRPPILEVTVLKIIAVLLVVWLVLTVLGAVIEGLFWLTVVGAVLFLATAGYGYLKRGAGPRQVR